MTNRIESNQPRCRPAENAAGPDVAPSFLGWVPILATGWETPRLNIRPARVGDVPAIYELIRVFAERNLMIRRSLGELYESIREFLVAGDDTGSIVGCVALHVFWDDLAELRCLAVAEQVQGQGLGQRLVEACWDSARALEIPSVFTLTHAVAFFERCGYHQIEKSELPHKIWN